MMKKIIIILLSIVSVAYSQDSTKSVYPIDRGGVGYKINNAELKGRAIDSTRIFKMGSDTVLRVADKWYARFAGIYGNGSDMTSKINLFNSRSYVAKMTFEYDTITNITINGTVNFIKPVEVGRNVSFTGSGTINFNGNILDADPDKVIFGPNITVTGLRTRNGLIPARWFGAVADGATDNYSFFNKAQSAAGLGMTVQIARGDHRINSAFTQTVSFFGDPGSLVKYNTASVATGVYMWTLSAPGIVLKNLTLDGSDKCMTIVRIGAFPDIHLIGDTLTEWNQNGSEPSNTQAVFFGQGCDRFKVLHCTIKNGDAKNNSVVRGIRGDYAGVGPVGAEIAWNTFSGIRGTAAGLDDADDICVQSFTNDLGMKIHHNLHLDVWKRAAKLMSNGIEYYENQIWSNRYATNSTKSWSVYSIYGNNVYAHNNTLWTGIFENCVDIGPYQDGSGPILNCSVENERFLMSTGASGTKDGIVLFGTNNNNITLKNNYIQNCRNGIASRGNARNFSIINNFVYNSTDNAYSLASTNTYPNNWFYNMTVNGNTARKCLQANFAIGRVSGGSFFNNNIDSCSDDLILNYAPYVDSLLGVAASGNTVSPAGYGSGKRVNLGNYSQRLTLTNPNTLPGLRYVAVDSSNASYLYQGGVYVKIGASAGGGAVSSVFGRTGAVAAQSGDYTFAQIGSKPTTLSGYGITDGVGNMRKITINGNNYDFSADRDVTGGVRGAISLTTIGTSGAATYNSSTGVLNVPQYSGGGGLPTIPTGYPYISNGSAGGDSSTALYVNRANKTIGINSTATTHSINVGYVADLMGIRLDMPSGYGYIVPRFNNSVELGTSGTGPHIIMYGASNQTTFKQVINQFEGQIYMLGATASRPQMLFADKSAAPSSPTAGWLWRDGDALNYRTSTGTVNLADPGFTNPMTTAGDIIVGGSSGTPTRLAKGTNGQVPKMVSGNIVWSTPMAVDTGSYIPTVDTTGSAISSWTSNRAFWKRIGDQVYVWGTFNITTGSGSAGLHSFSINIPIASTFTDNTSLSGSGVQTWLNSLGAIRVWPFYVSTPVTTATIVYTKTIGTTESFAIDYKFDYIISND